VTLHIVSSEWRTALPVHSLAGKQRYAAIHSVSHNGIWEKHAKSGMYREMPISGKNSLAEGMKNVHFSGHVHYFGHKKQTVSGVENTC